MYYAMKNCDGDADKLRRYIITIINHYKVYYVVLHFYPWFYFYFPSKFYTHDHTLPYTKKRKIQIESQLLHATCMLVLSR